jgi:hypothetical protein
MVIPPALLGAGLASPDRHPPARPCEAGPLASLADNSDAICDVGRRTDIQAHPQRQRHLLRKRMNHASQTE